MSVAPGMTFNGSGQVNATTGAGTVPNFINQGVGFMANGNLALDTAAPAGTLFDNGIAQSAAGAFYATVTPAGTDVFAAGVRVSTLGQIVVEVAVPTSFSNGNPVTANGRLGTT